MVLNQIAMKSYERSLIEPITTPSIKSDDSLNEIIKDTYIAEYLENKMNEKK